MHYDPHQVLFGWPGESAAKRTVEYEEGCARRVAYEFGDGGGRGLVIEIGEDLAVPRRRYVLGSRADWSPGARAARGRIAALAGGAVLDDPEGSARKWFVQMPSGNRIMLNCFDADRLESDILISHIWADVPGLGDGSKVLQALRQHADLTCRRLVFGLVANQRFFQKFDWLAPHWDGLEYIYDPRRRTS